MSKVNDDNILDELENGASFNRTRNSKAAVVKPKAKRLNYVKKVEHNWSHDEITKLIMAVKERRLLWDLSLPQNKLPKTDVWKEVADVIGNITVDDAKAKWMNLRICFKNNLAKYRLKKSGQGATKLVVVQWRYFKSMMFLEANDVQQSTESTTSFALASANSNASALKDFSVVLPPPCVGVAGKRKCCVTESPTPRPSSTASNNSKKELALIGLNSLRVHDDKFSAFGDYVASELRNLPPVRASFVQRALNRELLRLLEAEEISATQHRFATQPESGCPCLSKKLTGAYMPLFIVNK